MYVAVKGGEKAILNAHELLAEKRRGDLSVPELTVEQIENQLPLAVNRVMTEGSLYDPELAALAIKQASGDLIEAIFLLRAFRTTLTRLGVSLPIDTSQMTLWRRISATFKDLPGGQILGPTYDYTHRLLDFSLISDSGDRENDRVREITSTPLKEAVPRVLDLLNREGLIETAASEDKRNVGDLTLHPLQIPTNRDLRLQNLARGDEGFLLGLAYSTQRGFGYNHPFVGEIRFGEVAVEINPEELGFLIEIGEITVTECQMINQFKGSATQPPCFTRGYGLTFGHCERKAMAMALLDRSLRCHELGETVDSPAQDEEFVLMHNDNVQASGFVEHLKLPHYVDFQAELTLVRNLRSGVQQEKAEEEGK
ncbi:MAG: carbon-phosphorus lyase complex subunit PhnI [Deltaproteobacteria bacterium]|nr:carbon-phosphorus lyase complex subunit PhnI [Deltaproteobacteria bacterium]